jgi:hypothetical protein
MGLLSWESPIRSLCADLSTAPKLVLLSNCSLRFPSRDGLPGLSLPCSAAIEIDSRTGFVVRFQGRMDGSRASAHVVSAVIGARSSGPYRLRGKDSEGGVWFVQDTSLQISGNETTRVFSGSLAPNWLSVRSPYRSDGTPEIELAFDSEIALPLLDYDVISGGFERRVGAPNAGRLQSDEIDLFHDVVGSYRWASIADVPVVPASRSIQNFLDAVAYINGRRVDPLLTRITSSKGRSLHIHRRKAVSKQAIAPFAMNGEVGARRAWDVLLAYWKFVQSSNEMDRPKLSQVMAELHGVSSPTYVSSKALVAAVSLEGLVNHYIEGGPLRTKEQVSSFQAIIRELDLPTDAKDQCLQALGFMTRANATGRLRKLADASVVDHHHVRIWKDHRPKLAHSVERNPLDDLNCYLSCVAMFHAIAMGLIGIEDRYESRDLRGTKLLKSRKIPVDLLSTR